jgi:hypothetical protein
VSCIWPSIPLLVPGDQAVQVARVESDRTAEMNRGELAAFDQTLHGSRMDV